MASSNLSKAGVTLRLLMQRDAKALVVQANDKRIWDNLMDSFPHPYRLKDAQEFIELTSKQAPPRIFAITINNDLAGVIGLNELADVYTKCYEIGYWLGASFWGKGIATIAVGLLTDYAFRKLDCNRLQAGVYSYNPASMKVLEKCGYNKEGIFKQAVWKNQQFWDEHRYAILKPR